MNERKIEACAKAAFGGDWSRLTATEREALQRRAMSAIEAERVINGDSFADRAKVASHAWDAAIFTAVDSIDATRETLECEEASGAYDAMRAVESLRATAASI